MSRLLAQAPPLLPEALSSAWGCSAGRSPLRGIRQTSAPRKLGPVSCPQERLLGFMYMVRVTLDHTGCILRRRTCESTPSTRGRAAGPSDLR